MGGGGGGGGGVRVLRTLFGALVFVGFIWFLFVGILANRVSTKTTTATITTIPSTLNFKHLKLIGRERHSAHKDLDLNYVSKRRVPNGPDPIHNRRSRPFRVPPGRV
ncbi:hypothetical protein L1049_003091 [Liquidambar formosana]|uniref:CLAVATA3/ESR (CLE)-related protein 25 n=1 Tax=Liquidambar formosana TaxID=63359 RepID=A0AAP0R8L6_LIQFO